MIPAGFTVRPARHEDAAAIAALMGALDDAVGIENDTSESDVRAGWLKLELERDTRLVETGDGRLAAYVDLTERGPAPFFDGYVHPDAHGQGLGRALVRLGQELAAGRGDRVRTGILARDEAAACLLASEGFRTTRSFYRMTIDLDGPPPDPEVPPGIVLRPFELGEAEAFHRATEEAFADHWEWTPETFEAWEKRTIGADDFDPALWLTALDGDTIAGTLRGTAKRFGSGWVGSLAVRRPWRRRGLGAALLLASFGEFWRRGEPRVALGVDAESETGATRLYERLGMQIGWQADIYEKEIP